MPFIIGIALQFISNPIAKALVALIVSTVGGLLLTGLYLQWRGTIRAEDLAEYNAKQLQVTLQQTQDAMNQLQQLSDGQRMAIDSINATKDAIDAQLKGLEDTLNAPDNSPKASSILQQTIRGLGKTK